MKTFNIYVNPQGTYESVKQGWSWPGFFFTFIWSFIKKLWLPGSILLLIAILMGLFSSNSDYETAKMLDTFSNLIGLVAAIVFGINGNKWRETNLTKRGYTLQGTITAANGEAAINELINGENSGQSVTTKEM